MKKAKPKDTKTKKLYSRTSSTNYKKLEAAAAKRKWKLSQLIEEACVQFVS